MTSFLEVMGLAAVFAAVGGLLLGTVLGRRYPPCAACGQRSRRAARYNAGQRSILRALKLPEPPRFLFLHLEPAESAQPA